ncbi:MAG: hypothetical protein ACFFDF_03355, partial [Candidatus Odinarchaeota archaeon]
NLNTKSLMVITLLCSVIAMPMVAVGQEKDYNDAFSFDQVNVGIFDGFRGGFGALFSNNLGYAGKILGSIFETLFLEGLNLSAHEKLDNVYVISANTTETISGTKTFDSTNDKEYYFLPDGYNIPSGEGFAYCEVTKSGAYHYELEVGAAVTLVIWDHDKSFINAVNKLLNFFKKIIDLDRLGEQISQDLIREGISLLTWFLIHINDIFTGDELFVLNPITWQKLNITPLGYTINKTWKMSGNNYAIDDSDLIVNPSYISDWINNATDRKDNYMQWLLTPTTPGDLAETIWTQFSFDLIQLWVRNFEIHIDVSKLLNAFTGGAVENPKLLIASAFEGCDIDFYLFTHHLAGAFLYDDSVIPDNRISASYVNVTDNTGATLVDSAGDPIQVPSDSELTHRLILSTVENFKFKKPTINSGDRSISWGITLQNANISAVPMFVDLDSYLKAPEEELAYIYFGFTFEPTIDDELKVARGNVKLDQQFAPWNGGAGPSASIAGLDLAIIYVSTVLHFHLNVAVQDSSKTDELLDPNEDYIASSNELKVGNYLGRGAAEKLDFVNISGPYYEIGNDRSTALKYNASTNILPLMLWRWEMERHDTFTLADETTSHTFASDIRINTEFDVMIYAVCYPEFNGTGQGIWHDPTFSVYMVFQGEGFWALIVLIAGVGLVGVATILIKRRKDSRF